MLLLFTFGAVVQVNDPDPVRWIAIYALAAAACLLSLLRRLHWTLPAFLLVPSAIVPTFAWRARAEDELRSRTFGQRYEVYRRRTKSIIPHLL